MSSSVRSVLCASPSGTRIASLAMPASDSAARSGASQSAATTGLLTTTARGAGRSGASSRPAPPRMPAPMWIG